MSEVAKVIVIGLILGTLIIASITTPYYYSQAETQNELVFFNTKIEIVSDYGDGLFTVRMNDTEYDVKRIVYREENESIMYIADGNRAVRKEMTENVLEIDEERLEIGNKEFGEITRIEFDSGGVSIERNRNFRDDVGVGLFFESWFLCVLVAFTVSIVYYEEVK